MHTPVLACTAMLLNNSRWVGVAAVGSTSLYLSVMSFSALFISSVSVETATAARPVLSRFGSCKFMPIELFESEVSRTRTPTVNYKGKKYKDYIVAKHCLLLVVDGMHQELTWSTSKLTEYLAAVFVEFLRFDILTGRSCSLPSSGIRFPLTSM